MRVYQIVLETPGKGPIVLMQYQAGSIAHVTVEKAAARIAEGRGMRRLGRTTWTGDGCTLRIRAEEADDAARQA